MRLHTQLSIVEPLLARHSSIFSVLFPSLRRFILSISFSKRRHGAECRNDPRGLPSRRNRRRNPSAKDEEIGEVEEIYMSRAEGDYSEGWKVDIRESGGPTVKEE